MTGRGEAGDTDDTHDTTDTDTGTGTDDSDRGGVPPARPAAAPVRRPLRDLTAVPPDLRAVDGAGVRGGGRDAHAGAGPVAAPAVAGRRPLEDLPRCRRSPRPRRDRPRRAAALGVGALALASTAADVLGERLVRRPRPDREAARVAGGRRVPMPASAAFPSGHTAADAGIATAVGAVLPAAAVPLGTLAGAVAYARVRTGVHYPGDVAAGAVPGTASAAAVPAAGARLPRVRRSGREVTTAAVPGGR
jgi:undecaprenyl-diphosphatase